MVGRKGRDSKRGKSDWSAIRLESTPVGGKERAASKPRLVAKKRKTRKKKGEARTIVRRWRAKSVAWPQPRSSDVKAFRSKEARKGGRGCDRIALRLLEPLNIAGRISLAFARPVLLDFPRPAIYAKRLRFNPSSLARHPPRHRPRCVHATYRISAITTRNPLFSSLLFEISQRGKKCWSPSTPPFCSSQPISTFSGEWYSDSDQQVRCKLVGKRLDSRVGREFYLIKENLPNIKIISNAMTISFIHSCN